VAYKERSTGQRIDILQTQIEALIAARRGGDYSRFHGREWEFVRDVLKVKMWRGQSAIVQRLFEKRFVAVR